VRRSAILVRASTLVERVGQLDPVTRECLMDGLGIGRLRVRAWMGINFRQTFGQSFKEFEQCARAHAPGRAQTADAVAECDVILSQCTQCESAESGKDATECTARRGFADEAYELKSVCACDWKCEPKDCWMKVKVRVPVPVSRRETQGAKPFELSRNLRSEIGFKRGAEEVLQACFHWRGLKPPALVGQRGELRRDTRTKREMQPHAKARMLASKARGIFGVWLVYHQTRLGKDACVVLINDCGVDLRALAKVVTGEDERFRNIGHAFMVQKT
jgi:hypothetical protein